MAGGQDISACPSSWVLQTCHHCSGDKGQCGNNDAWPTMTNADCRASINGGNVVSVQYDATNCARYNCAENTQYDGGDIWQTWATCNTDCTHFALSVKYATRVVSSETKYDSARNIEPAQCMRWCFETPLCYTFMWTFLDKMCTLYTECGITCGDKSSLLYLLDFVVIRTCHGRKLSF